VIRKQFTVRWGGDHSSIQNGVTVSIEFYRLFVSVDRVLSPSSIIHRIHTFITTPPPPLTTTSYHYTKSRPLMRVFSSSSVPFSVRFDATNENIDIEQQQQNKQQQSNH
jgi:hypothetical protein